jgi:microcystin-dependent protein
MSDQFLGEIRMVGFNFPPNGWAQCNGQLLPISQNTALFSLLGTYYGGDGKSTFALPNFQGVAPISQGNGSGLSPRVIGETGSSYSVSLQTTQIPSHNHPANCISGGGNSVSAANNIWAAEGGRAGKALYTNNSGPVNMNQLAVQLTGGNQPHNNIQPYLTVTFVIAMQGIYPTRS